MNVIIEEIVSEFPILITEEVVQIAIFDVTSYFDLTEVTDRDFVGKDNYVPTVDEASGKIILKEQTGGGGSQSLAQTLAIGNVTGGNNLNVSSGDAIVLDNGSLIHKGTNDEGTGGSGGIELVCAAGYPLKWEGGALYSKESDGVTNRPLNIQSNVEVENGGSSYIGDKNVTQQGTFLQIEPQNNIIYVDTLKEGNAHIVHFGINNSEPTVALDVVGAIKNTTTITTGGYTVATLPAGVIGMMTYVTDALAPAYGVAVAGSGAVTIPVFFNGTDWICH